MLRSFCFFTIVTCFWQSFFALARLRITSETWWRNDDLCSFSTLAILRLDFFLKDELQQCLRLSMLRHASLPPISFLILFQQSAPKFRAKLCHICFLYHHRLLHNNFDTPLQTIKSKTIVFLHASLLWLQLHLGFIAHIQPVGWYRIKSDLWIEQVHQTFFDRHCQSSCDTFSILSLVYWPAFGFL